ncbi:MAG: hypothetical protein O7I93_10290 [Gemmatimonadetes bacterium]|nr:hypothetical protein [Gemmatimonadota bacterium]
MAHIHPQMGFTYFPSLGIPVNERKYVKADVEKEIDRIDPGHVWRDAKEHMAHYHPPSGHVEEDYIKGQLDIEVPNLGDEFAAGYQVDLCYIVVDARVICYHCYGLLEDQPGTTTAKQVTVQSGGHSVDVLVYFSYSTPPVH